jgi:hypothetical protein
MKQHPAIIPSPQDYAEAFHAEALREYPSVDAFERTTGYRIPRGKLEAAAQVLACPVKASAPNWQHGRVLYAAMRAYLEHASGPVRCVDIGTAKGFSALVAQWALNDAGMDGVVESVDVIDPFAKVYRNSVLDCAQENRLADYLRPWPEAGAIRFYQSTGIDWLSRSLDRVHVAFVDGKHSADVVAKEGALLAERQQPGDLVMFDDCQIPAVRKAVFALDAYELTGLALGSVPRTYAIGRRK